MGEYTYFEEIFLKFANEHIEYDNYSRPSEVFKDIDQAKISFDVDEYKNESLYMTPQEALDYQRGFLKEEEFVEKTRKIIVHTRLLSCINEFRNFLMKSDFYAYFPKDGSNRIKARDLACTDFSFSRLVENKFESYKGHPLQAEKTDVENALNDYFRIGSPISDEKKLWKNLFKEIKNYYCMHELFGNFKCIEILTNHPFEHSYKDKKEIHLLLEKDYGVGEDFIKRILLPTLRDMRVKFFSYFNESDK